MTWRLADATLRAVRTALAEDGIAAEIEALVDALLPSGSGWTVRLNVMTTAL